jgi:hypothetical protein
MASSGITTEKHLEKAIQIAVNAHFGQVDKAGKPYIFHPLRVMNACYTIDEKIVAILHDTIEDTGITEKTLVDSDFPAFIVDAILSLSRLENELYSDFICRVSLNPIAANVKIADLKDNLNVSRLPIVTEKDTERLNKYIKALDFLIKKTQIVYSLTKAN